MRMNNKSGFIAIAIVFTVIFGVIGAVCISKIPAWERAKNAHCEAAYQAGNYKCGDTK